MLDKSSYLSLAEDNYAFFMEAAHHGMAYNAMTVISQKACEMYLKDLIDRYYIPEDEVGLADKESIMETNSLARLIKFIINILNVEIKEEIRDAIERVDIYYYSTIYPGVNSIEVDEWDIRKAKLALENVRKLQTQHSQRHQQICLGSHR